ncbi:Papain family cysteine protease [Carpediemonas membranifera]|uniref:Papain family cysteine protease n=1 Tax=Carpediemonas membranifera TaxID=201153 RepID=A0A8J6E1H8_9EUKA|nr:Papain family cysteine protease [Carpediemonas membranifera]|eukprot:KAG9390652.1 Papain family cysteine protease [Carpediemonas membranifera]
MKFIIALAVIALAFAQLTEREAEMIRQTSPSFQVGIHEKFVGKSDWELSRMVMRTIPARRPRMFAESTFELDYTLPESFDSRDKWGASCPTVKEIRNQAQCGSCWAFGAAESSSDRYCIAKGESVKFSAQWLVSCDHTDHGCNGGAMYNVWNYIKNYGIVPNSCLSYKSAQGDVPACPSTCEDGSAPRSTTLLLSSSSAPLRRSRTRSTTTAPSRLLSSFIVISTTTPPVSTTTPPARRWAATPSRSSAGALRTTLPTGLSPTPGAMTGVSVAPSRSSAVLMSAASRASAPWLATSKLVN